MHVTRMYTGDDGKTHFEDLDVPFEPAGNKLGKEVAGGGDLLPLQGVVFRHAPPGHDHGYSNAPRRQFVVTLTGRFEVSCGDGTTCVFGPGDILLADDLTGEGHTSHQFGDEERKMLFLILNEDQDVSQWRRRPDDAVRKAAEKRRAEAFSHVPEHSWTSR